MASFSGTVVVYWVNAGHDVCQVNLQRPDDTRRSIDDRAIAKQLAELAQIKRPVVVSCTCGGEVLEASGEARVYDDNGVKLVTIQSPEGKSTNFPQDLSRFLAQHEKEQATVSISTK